MLDAAKANRGVLPAMERRDVSAVATAMIVPHPNRSVSTMSASSAIPATIWGVKHLSVAVMVQGPFIVVWRV